MNDDLHQECEATGSTSPKKEPVPSNATTKLVGIYGLQNKLKPEKWYIGQSWDINHRWSRYRLLHCKRQPKIYNALLKYGYNGFEKIIIELCDKTCPQDMLDIKETAWIKHYNSVDNGYNLTYGGHTSTHGTKMSEETKQKIRLTKIGKPLSEEHRKKLSEAGKKKKLSEEHKKKIGEKSKGRTYSLEVRQKMGNAGRGRVWTEEDRKKMSESCKRSRQLKLSQSLPSLSVVASSERDTPSCV